jgi:DNA-binding NarL/FixJ family response regulator
MTREARPETVIVVGDDAMYAARLEAVLHELPGCRVEVCKPRELRRLVEERPDAIVAMATVDARARRLLRAMRAWSRRPMILALTDDPAASWTAASRALGLRAALPLTATAAELAAAVAAVRAGLFAVHPDALVATARRTSSVTGTASLTAREREILEMMADGAHNRAIASRLAISRHTVKFHVASILAKLGATSRTEAVALALRRGLLAV